MNDAIKVGVARSREGNGDGLIPALESARGVTVVGVFSYDNGSMLPAAAGEPDVLLVDVSTDLSDPAELTKRMISSHPSARVMVLTCSDRQQDLAEAVRAGARGYVVKPAGPGDLLRALRLVAVGHMVIDRRFAAMPVSISEGDQPRQSRGRDGVLGERAIEVLTSAAAGRDDEEIAADLDLSLRTVRRHLATACTVFGAPDRETAVARARHLRYLLGRGKGFYGIWDIQRPGGPVERFEETERTNAWLRWRDLTVDRQLPGPWRRVRGWLRTLRA